MKYPGSGFRNYDGFMPTRSRSVPSPVYPLITLGLCALALWPGPALAQPKSATQAAPAVLPELVLPQTTRREWIYQQGKKVWLQLSPQPVEQVLLHYLAISRKPGWQLTFPAEAEAAAWLEALERSHESKVFMLNLYHLKSKVNYVLTVGELSDTRQFSARSIITIYSRQRPFGR